MRAFVGGKKYPKVMIFMDVSVSLHNALKTGDVGARNICDSNASANGRRERSKTRKVQRISKRSGT